MYQLANQDIADLHSRIDEIHSLLAGRDRAAGMQAAAGLGRAEHVLGTKLVDQLAISIQLRRLRRSHFGFAPMSGPPWDMMLDLMLANANGRLLSASDLAAGAEVPLSSGLRIIAALERAGLVKRSIDDRDRRRSIVRLTDTGTERMASYFEKVTMLLHSRTSAQE